MELQTLKYEKQDGIATITMNRPDKRNSLSSQVFKELSDCFDDADRDKKVRALIITGGDKVFCAGMDIAEMLELKEEEVFSFWNLGANITMEKLYNFRVPTIAAISGFTVAGGFDMAVCCDFRIVTETAKFGQPEVDIHLSPGVDRLWRLIGLSRAKYLGMTGDIIDAQEAYRIGLADKIVKVEDLQKEARTLAAKFVAKPREAIERTKQAYINEINMDHKTAINYEVLSLSYLFNSDECRRILESRMKRK